METPASSGLEALDDVVGLVDDPALPDDIAEHHDHYLYGSPAAEAVS